MTTAFSQHKIHPGPPPASWINSTKSLTAQARAQRVWYAASCLILNKTVLEHDLGRYEAMVSDVRVSTTPRHRPNKAANRELQEEYTLLVEEGMEKEQTIERLIGLTRGHRQQQPAFNPNGFRSLEGQERDAGRDVGEHFESVMADKSDLNDLYVRLRNAQRLFNELNVAESILRGVVGGRAENE